MPQIPWQEIWDLLRLLLAPGVGASLAVMLLLRLPTWALQWGAQRFNWSVADRLRRLDEWWSPWPVAAALVAGVIAANHFNPKGPEATSMPYQLDRDRPVTCSDLRTAVGWSLESKPQPKAGATPEEVDEPPEKFARYWIPWLALVALLIELVAAQPCVPTGAAWAARSLAAVFAARLLTPAALRPEMPGASWLLAGVILVEWTVLTALARQWKDGTVALAVGLCLAAGGMVLLHAGTAIYMEIDWFFFAALLGVAALAMFLPSETGPALAAAAVVLPGLLLIGLYEQDPANKVPFDSFVLAALAPLALAPLLLPFLVRLRGWKRWLAGLILPLTVAATAVVLAAQAEPLHLDDLSGTADAYSWESFSVSTTLDS